MAEEKKTSKKAEKEEKTEKSSKASKPAKKKSKKNPFKSIASFFKSVKAEGKKVVWAKPMEVLRNTVIVLIVVAIVGVCIYIVDTGLSLGMKGLKNLAETETTASETVTEESTSDVVLEEDTTETTEAAE